jgi:hypothetical protein
MSFRKFRKKPVVIEAVQYNALPSDPLVLGMFIEQRGLMYWDENEVCRIKTLEGDHIVSPGDWVIKGVKGEFYACKPDIFALTYEEVRE